MKTKNILFLTAILVLIISILSCKKDNKNAPVQILLTDKPAVYDSVNVHIVGVEVQIDNDNAAWIPIHTKDSIYNLLDLQNGISSVIAQDTIPAGVLNQIRFILGDGNEVVVNGTSYLLATPSAEESGLKIKIGKALNETLNTFTLDFNASLSISQENGVYKLHPVIQMK
jgi:antitoxin component of MazEF toxin-antitoxin module